MHDSNPASFVEKMIDELLTDDSADTVEDHADAVESDTAIDSVDKNNPVAIKNEDISMDSIQLSDECTIYEIAQIHQKIHDNWQAKTSLNLDVSAVTEVDASFIQLLASCKKMALDNNQSFELINPSEVLSNKINSMYMSDYFNSEPAIEE